MSKCSYQKPETYGQFLDGNPCDRCRRPEVEHLTPYVVTVEPNRGQEGYLIVYALMSADALAIAERKGYPLTGAVREATEADSKPIKTLRPWS